MNRTYHIIVNLAICVVQILLNNYLNISQYVLVSLLPLVVMSLPLKRSTNFALFVAFFAGMAVDLLSSSQLGCTSICLLVCAFLKNTVFKLVYGDEIFSYRDGCPLTYQSSRETGIAISILCAIYFLLYALIDSAGTLPLNVNLLRWVISSAISALLCFICTSVLYKGE